MKAFIAGVVFATAVLVTTDFTILNWQWWILVLTFTTLYVWGSYYDTP